MAASKVGCRGSRSMVYLEPVDCIVRATGKWLSFFAKFAGYSFGGALRRVRAATGADTRAGTVAHKPARPSFAVAEFTNGPSARRSPRDYHGRRAAKVAD